MMFFLIAAFTGMAYGQGPDDNSCLIQRPALKNDNWNRFSDHQQQCIAAYVSDVQTVVPGYDLSDRHFGGTSGAFPADARPPILAPGFGTTATRSLAHLARQLGLKVHHYIQNPATEDLTELVTTKSCNERTNLNDINFLNIMLELEEGKGPGRTKMLMDSPIGELFLDWYAASPASKVILTVRESLKWATERKAYHYPSILPYESPCGGYFGELQPQVLAQMMDFHTTLVRCMVPSEKFLEINIFEDKDTMRVNRFLGFPNNHLEMPIVPPPTSSSKLFSNNTNEEMDQKWKAMKPVQPHEEHQGDKGHNAK